MKRMMVAAAVVLAVSTVASAPASAFHCPKDMKKIDETLVAKRSTSLSGSKFHKVTRLRAVGEPLHESGMHEETV